MHNLLVKLSSKVEVQCAGVVFEINPERYASCVRVSDKSTKKAGLVAVAASQTSSKNALPRQRLTEPRLIYVAGDQ